MSNGAQQFITGAQKAGGEGKKEWEKENERKKGKQRERGRKGTPCRNETWPFVHS